VRSSTTFALMDLLRASRINTLTLLAMVLAIGLVVDDAIVVLENIHRHIEDGHERRWRGGDDAACARSSFAVIAMTLTLAAVYAPVAFMTGAHRHAVHRVRADPGRRGAGVGLRRADAHAHDVLAPAEGPRAEPFRARHGARAARRRRAATAARWAGCSATAGWRCSSCWPAAPAAPGCGPTRRASWRRIEDRGVIFTPVSAPDGATLGYTARYLDAAARLAAEDPEAERVFAFIGGGQVSSGAVIVRYSDWDERKRSTRQMAQALQPKLAQLPGVQAFPVTPPSLGQGFRSRPLSYVIVANDSYANLGRVVQQFQAEMARTRVSCRSTPTCASTSPNWCWRWTASARRMPASASFVLALACSSTSCWPRSSRASSAPSSSCSRCRWRWPARC
jgi:multidrug efflux pump